jgi:pre-mRNA-processing factor 8
LKHAWNGNCSSVPNIVLTGTELQLPFQACFKIEKFGDTILKATEPQMLLYNIYDDWLKSVSSYTAFSRLILILRALHVNLEKANMIIRPDKSVYIEIHHIWPSLSDQQWIMVEQSLKDMILADYAKKNNVNLNALTQTEIRDIILGAEITPPSQQQQQIADIEKQAKISAQLTAVTTKTHDKHGNEIIVTTTSPYEQETLITKTDWRVRAISAANLHLRANRIFVRSEETKEDDYTYILPKNLAKKFICIADLRTQIAGLIFGLTPQGRPQVKEIHCILMPPQWGNYHHVNIPHLIPDNEKINDLEPLGWIHTQPNESKEIAPSDLAAHIDMLSIFPTWNGEKCISISIAFTPGSCSIMAYRTTTQGYEALKESSNRSLSDEIYQQIRPDYYEKVAILLSNHYLGYFMSPELGSWNYNFMGVKFTLNMNYKVKIANPKEFYHEVHRPVHFMEFSRSKDTLGLELDLENVFV